MKYEQYLFVLESECSLCSEKDDFAAVCWSFCIVNMKDLRIIYLFLDRNSLYVLKNVILQQFADGRFEL